MKEAQKETFMKFLDYYQFTQLNRYNRNGKVEFNKPYCLYDFDNPDNQTISAAKHDLSEEFEDFKKFLFTPEAKSRYQKTLDYIDYEINKREHSIPSTPHTSYTSYTSYTSSKDYLEQFKAVQEANMICQKSLKF